MKNMAIAGILLVLLGVVALVYQGITYTSRDTVIDIGPVHATAERQHTLPLPPVLGALAIIGGAVLLVGGLRKKPGAGHAEQRDTRAGSDEPVVRAPLRCSVHRSD